MLAVLRRGGLTAKDAAVLQLEYVPPTVGHPHGAIRWWYHDIEGKPIGYFRDQYLEPPE
jgi:hypothetical protein